MKSQKLKVVSDVCENKSEYDKREGQCVVTRSGRNVVKPDTVTYSLFHKKRNAFTRKVLKKTSFFSFGTTVRIKH